MWWKLYQLAVFVGVGCLLIYWRENDPTVRENLNNGYLIGLVALIATFLATVIVSKLLLLKQRPHKGLGHGVPRSRTGRVEHRRLPRDTPR